MPVTQVSNSYYRIYNPGSNGPDWALVKLDRDDEVNLEKSTGQ